MNEENLFQACDAGNFDEVQTLLNKFFLVRPNINAQAPDGYRPLVWALRKGHKNIVQLLIESGADIDAKDKYGQTDLYKALQVGQTEIAKQLIEVGADAKAEDKFGNTALHIASDAENVKLLIANGADVNAIDEHGFSVISGAAIHGYTKKIKILLDNGADVNAKDQHGYTPLLKALQDRHIKAAQLLIEYGADVNVELFNGQVSVMKEATLSGNTEIAKLLINQETDISRYLRLAAYMGQTETAKMFIDMGTDVNSQDKDGVTALIEASKNGHVKTARMLLNHAAYIDAQDVFGETALIATVSAGHTSVVKLLIEKGADVHIQDNHGNTALSRALDLKREMAAEMLQKEKLRENVSERDLLKMLRCLDTVPINEIPELFALAALWAPISDSFRSRLHALLNNPDMSTVSKEKIKRVLDKSTWKYPDLLCSSALNLNSEIDASKTGALSEIIIFRCSEDGVQPKYMQIISQWMGQCLGQYWSSDSSIRARYHSHLSCRNEKYRNDKILEILSDPKYPNLPIDKPDRFLSGHRLYVFQGTPDVESWIYAFFELKSEHVGASPMESRFVVIQKGITKDTARGLMWGQSQPSDKMDWHQGVAYTENLRLGGYSDWRLPTVKELEGLIKYAVGQGITEHFHEFYNMFGFTDWMPSYYWTSSPVENSINQALSVYFDYGDVSEYGKDNVCSVRSVRKANV